MEISHSLRNSLLSLRHSRRYLAYLVQQHQEQQPQAAQTQTQRHISHHHHHHHQSSRVKHSSGNNNRREAHSTHGSNTPVSSSTSSSYIQLASFFPVQFQQQLAAAAAAAAASAAESSKQQQQQEATMISSSSSASSSASARKPCVYMLNEGRCARSDCRFVHDLKSITCKYWLDGECLKGDACEFLHDHIAPTPPPPPPLLPNSHGISATRTKQQPPSKAKRSLSATLSSTPKSFRHLVAPTLPLRLQRQLPLQLCSKRNWTMRPLWLRL